MARVDLDNRQVAAAGYGARYAANKDLPPTSCPYVGDDPETAALRRVWVSNYLRSRPPAPGRVAYDD